MLRSSSSAKMLSRGLDKSCLSVSTFQIMKSAFGTQNALLANREWRVGQAIFAGVLFDLAAEQYEYF